MRPLAIVRLPGFLRDIFPSYQFRIPQDGDQKKIYLTFDDGPTPGVTPWVLDELKNYNAKATFFLIGRNVERNPGIFRRIRDEGHSVGHHTYSHLNGVFTGNRSYVKDVLMASRVVDSRLFRPPYGRMNFIQRRRLARYYRIIMWDVMSYDFNTEVSPQECYHNVADNLQPGNIVVFHDSEKARQNMQYSLSRVLEEFGGKYEFASIPM